VSDRCTAPQFEHSALISIDTQRDVLDGEPLEIAGTSAALPAMGTLARAFRAAGRPIVHIVRIYRPDGENVDLCRREAVANGARMLLAGAQGTELAQELLDRPLGLDTELLLGGGIQEVDAGEAIIYKPRWGAFYRTPLQEHLRALGVSTLVFCGCNFPNCPRTSIYQASERDFRVVLVTDAISGLYERGERELEGIGVSLMDTAAVCSELTASPARA
jgi:nicotinamidase-related amidase